jgi:hypothetical protein
VYPPTPEQYASTDAFTLLRAASQGYLAFDHRLVHALVDEPARTLRDIVRFAIQYEPGDHINLAPDLTRLLAYLRAPEAIPFLVEQVKNAGEDLPEELIEALVAVGPHAVGPLLEAAEDDEGSEAAFVLAVLGVRDPRILETLLGILKRDPEEGAFLLGLYGDRAAREAIEAAEREYDGDKSAFATALRSIEEERTQPSGLEPFDIWGHFPEVEDGLWSLIPGIDLAEYLESPEPYHRLQAARAYLEELDEDSLEPVFQHAQTDPDAAVRAACWEALATEVEDERIAEAMQERVKDPATPIVELAALAVALAPLPEVGEDVHEAVRRGYSDPAMRPQALEAMGL